MWKSKPDMLNLKENLKNLQYFCLPAVDATSGGGPRPLKDADAELGHSFCVLNFSETQQRFMMGN